MRARTRLAAAATMLAVALAGGVAAGTPAAAVQDDDGELSLSVDGSTWSRGLSDDLFADVEIVPGDVVRRDLWARNDGPDDARVLIEVHESVTAVPGGGPHLVDWIAVRIDGEPVAEGARWYGPVLGPGEAARVEIEVSKPAEAPASTRRLVAPVLAVVHLVSTEAVPPPEDPPEPAPDLPPTGAASTIAILLATALVVAGALTRATRRRAHRASHHSRARHLPRRPGGA